MGHSLFGFHVKYKNNLLVIIFPEQETGVKFWV